MFLFRYLFLLLMYWGGLVPLVWGQIDSVQALLQSDTLTATTRVNALNYLAFLHWQTDLDKMDSLAGAGVELARQIAYKAGEAEGVYMQGFVHDLSGDYPRAVRLYRQALFWFDSLDRTSDASRVMEYLGVVYRFQAKYDSSLFFYFDALRIMESEQNQRRIGNILNSIGNVFMDQSKYDQAEQYYQRALEAKQQTGDLRSLSNTLGNLADLKRRQGNIDAGIAAMHRVLAIKQEIQDLSGITTAQNALGIMHSEQNRYDSARYYLYAALQIDRQLENVRDISQTLLQIGRLHARFTRELTAGVAAIEEAIALGERGQDLGLLNNAYQIKADIETYLGNYPAAVESLQKVITYKDSLYKTESLQQMLDIQTRYETEKKEQENQLLRSEKIRRDLEINQQQQQLQRQNLLLALSLASLIFLGIVAYLLYRQRQLKERVNAALQNKNRQINAQKEELSSQAERLRQVNEEIKVIHENLQESYALIERKNNNITASINYAQRIQAAALPDLAAIQAILGEFFVFFKPRDIVSGDFYWFSQKNNRVFLAAVDCTGHGVPGAFMSLIGINILNQIVNEQDVWRPEDILSQLHVQIHEALRQEQTANRDGMDMSLICWEPTERRLHFAGAKNPLIYFQPNDLKQISGDRVSVGGRGQDRAFTGHTIALDQHPITFYLFSDGYQDQFGGQKGRKRMLKGLKELLENVHALPLAEQQQRIDQDFQDWCGNNNQIDDVLLLGVRL